MNIILWVIFGALAGWVASLITHSRQGLIRNIILGVIGAVLGGLIMNIFGVSGITGFNIYSLIVAIIGAIVVVSIGRFFEKNA